MSIHKYIFYINEKGIKTYRIRNKKQYEIVKYQGETICKEKDLNIFFEWFIKITSIRKDEALDLCFLSEEIIEVPLLNYPKVEISSWVKEEVLNFCEKEIIDANYEIVYSETNSFYHQVSNINDKEKMKKLYLKCIPENCLNKEGIVNIKSEETSILSQYFREKLSKI